MPNRKSMSKKSRFEVFKRDKFTCQYCGKSAPDVILHVDHVHPVSKGGENTILNLITSCQGCNFGKGARELSDESVIIKQRAALDKLQEKREQIDMMIDWQKSLVNLTDDSLNKLADFWKDLSGGFSVTDNGTIALRKTVKKYGFQTVIKNMRISYDQYAQCDDEGNPIPYTVVKAFDYIARICANEVRMKDKPYLRDLYYIRGIVRNRMSYCNDSLAINLLEKAYLLGADIDELKNQAITSKNWSTWRACIENAVNTSEIEQSKNNEICNG